MREEQKKMEVKEAFERLEDEWHGNYIYMPYDLNLQYRELMKQAFREHVSVPLALRNMCKLDLFFLCHSVLGYVDTKQDVHRPFCDNIQRHPKGSVNMMPRGYFKSSIGTIGRTVQLQLNDPLERVLIANKTATLAEKFCANVRSIFETNSQIRELFPELIPHNLRKVKWSDQGFELNRPEKFVTASVEAVGVGGTRVGHHYTTIVFDDLVDEDEIASINQMDKVIEWLKLAMGSFGVKGSFNEVHNATRWAYYDPLSWVLDNRKELVPFILSCYDENKESTFPEVYTSEQLKELETIKGTVTFSAQFLNDPIPSGTQSFRPDWIQFYDELPKKPMRTYILADPAVSEDNTSCLRAIVVVSVDEDWNWFIRDFSAGRYPLIHPTELSMIGEIFTLYMAYNPWFVGIESIGFQQVVSGLIRREMEDRRVWFNVTGMKPDPKHSKEMRIEALVMPFGAKKVFIHKSLEGSELHKELIGYPAYRWRDVVDALSYLMRYAWPTSPEKAEPIVAENTLKDIHNRIDKARQPANVLEFRKPKRLDRYAESI